jgi:hypothetical protein
VGAGDCTLGECVGRTLEGALFTAEGSADAITVDSEVGLALDRTPDWLAVGGTERCMDGPAVGATLTVPLGTAVGSAVGSALGSAGGSSVGSEVGSAVGAEVGALVGYSVGVVVGLVVAGAGAGAGRGYGFGEGPHPPIGTNPSAAHRSNAGGK